ncbi:GNAT family N-acetyltransferase [Lactococcus nasutitermitis]|uniref:GNAT family N-acetyltransferase n=1 Tax=Lactococcus nasutitermitis TaxID=1652957 RepID=A0ABV9JBV1_9LACT|nr:GNAT family protein [Lactococcus nasutitermitis]
MNIILRELELKDCEDYLYWNNPSREFHHWNGPYYASHSKEELEKQVSQLKNSLSKGQKNVLKNKKIIADKENDAIIGEVSWYWKSQETLWLEIGIVIFNENYWGNGIGTEALKAWIDQIFQEKPELVRLGLSTWSGNKRMMKLAEKCGMQKEAEYRKARIVDGSYYDAISFGILREEWQNFLEKEKL